MSIPLFVVLTASVACGSGSDPTGLSEDAMSLEFSSEVVPVDSPLIGQLTEGTGPLGWASFELGFLTPGSGYELGAELRVLAADRVDVLIRAEQNVLGSDAAEGHHFRTTIHGFPKGRYLVRVLVDFVESTEPTRTLVSAYLEF